MPRLMTRNPPATRPLEQRHPWHKRGTLVLACKMNTAFRRRPGLVLNRRLGSPAPVRPILCLHAQQVRKRTLHLLNPGIDAPMAARKGTIEADVMAPGSDVSAFSASDSRPSFFRRRQQLQLLHLHEGRDPGFVLYKRQMSDRNPRQQVNLMCADVRASTSAGKDESC